MTYSFEMPDGSIGHDAPQAAAAWMREGKRLREMIEDACKVFEHYDLPEHALHYRRAVEQAAQPTERPGNYAAQKVASDKP